jgi:hypothetical protein
LTSKPAWTSTQRVFVDAGFFYALEAGDDGACWSDEPRAARRFDREHLLAFEIPWDLFFMRIQR